MATVERWVTWQGAQGRAEHTITNRRHRVEAFAEWLGSNPADATEDDVINYMAQIKRKAGTKATYLAQIRAWFAWLVLTEYRADDPTARIKPPTPPRREPREITAEQVDLVLAAPMRHRTRMMVLLAVRQGLRVHEIAKIRGEDVDRTGRTLRVEGKGGHIATLPLHREVEAFAAEFPALGPWFPNSKGQPVTARSVSDTLADLMRRAGIPGGGHRLRHTFATQLQENGNSLLTTQKLMRHANPSSTAIYARPSTEQQREAIDGLGRPA